MDKNKILENLAEIAAALDDQNMTREADAVAQVMTRVAQQAPNPFAPTNPLQPQQILTGLEPFLQKAVSQEDALVKRYLGWAFHAISVKKVSVANARAALQQHLQANKQTPEFIQKTLQAFDSQIASQKALQERRQISPRKQWAMRVGSG